MIPINDEQKTKKWVGQLISRSTSIGRRQYQQDFTMIPDEDEVESGTYLCVLCDGMGGMEQGELASRLAAQSLYTAFHRRADSVCWPDFFQTQICEASRQVTELTDEEGNPIECGSTLIAAVVDEGKLYWASVGDSRIYFIRDGEIRQLTSDQNYGQLLLGWLQEGTITLEEANADPMKDALTSYIGLPGEPDVDRNALPIELREGDVILLCSDGLYRTLDEEQVLSIVAEHRSNIPMAAYMLVQSALEAGLPGQDNTTVILIKYSNKKDIKENEHNEYEEM